MDLREITEKREMETLSIYGKKSVNSSGRKEAEDKCSIRTEFQRDKDRITHSKAFRRLMHKTQVFISPEGDHYRTRLTHTIEVSQIARTISRALSLNEDLTEAIALGHDLGHTPFGHIGEHALDQIYIKGFRHNEQSLRVVDILEKGGKGLNLTYEVRDGILNHRSGLKPSTLEGRVVQISDKIAYINHDIDDAIRANILNQKDLPKDPLRVLGQTSSNRINFLIQNIIDESKNKDIVELSPHVKESIYNLRAFMFDNVYTGQLRINESQKIQVVLKKIYDYYLLNYEKLPKEFINIMNSGDSLERVVIDYIACMTDRYAISTFNKIFIPSSWKTY